MKKILAATLLFSASVLSAADVSGVYVGKATQTNSQYPHPSAVPLTLTLQEIGPQINGLIQFNNDTIKLTSGSISGNQVTVAFPMAGTQYTGSLTVSGNTVTGTVTAHAGPSMSLSATKK